MPSPPSPSITEAEREARCPARFHQSCSSLNQMLGWKNGLSGDRCDACFALGPETPAGVAYRRAQVDLTISIYRNSPAKLAALSHQVLEALEKHYPPEEWATLVGHPAVAEALAKREMWVPVQPVWEKAHHFTRSLASDLVGRVDPSDRAHRNVSCFGLTPRGQRVAEPCPSLRLGANGRTHYCGVCGCGDTEIARLDAVPPETRTKLDFPYLACPRKRPGFSNSPPAPAFEEPPVDLHTLVDHVYLINLARRPDRLQSFIERFNDTFFGKEAWPLPEWEVVDATDGTACPLPVGWPAGSGAWGCLRSHLRVMEDALARGYRSILVLEDDAEFTPDFTAKLRDLVGKVPDDWECLMLGGQHRPVNTNCEHLEPGLVRCLNTQRTHAFIVREQGLRDLYQEWCSRWGHCDHIMGPFLGARGRTYAPDPFIVAQAEGKSDINGRTEPQRLWATKPADVPVVIILCPPEQCLPIKERMATLGCHFGYKMNDRNHMDAGVHACFEHSPPIFTTLQSKWLVPASWEAQAKGRIPTIIHPLITPDNLPNIVAAVGHDRARPIAIPSIEACRPIQELLTNA